jgi:hypothetical protein
MKDGLQGVLDILNRIDFEKIGEGMTNYLKASMDQIDDFRRGLEGVDLSGFTRMLKLFGAAWWEMFQLIGKYNIYEYIGKAVKVATNAINGFLNILVDGYVGAINTVIDSHNKLVPLLQKVGMDIDYINRLSVDGMLSGFLRKADDEAKGAKDSVDDLAKSVTELSDVSSNAKIPGWAGQSDYIRERLKETGGRNIGDLLGMAGVSSNIGGNQTVGSLTSVNNNQNIVNPNASLVDINRSGFNTIASKLDSVVNAVNNININVSSGGGFSSGVSSRCGTSPNDVIAHKKESILGVGQVRLRY